MANEKGRGLTSIGDLLPGVADSVPELKPALKEAERQSKALTVQGKHHFTRLKQLDALETIGDDGNPDMGFMHRLLTLCSLPRTDPGDRLQYKRQNGPFKLFMLAGGDNKLPFGNLPRLLLAWVCTEAVRTQDPTLYLGQSLAKFMQDLGIYNDSGGSRGDRTRLKTQIDRLFNCHIDLIYEPVGGPKISTGGKLAPKTLLWWDYKVPEQDTLFKSWVRLGDELFGEIIAHPVPINMKILKAMRRSSLGLDLYMWLSYKTFGLYRNQQHNQKLFAQMGGRVPTKDLKPEKDKRTWQQLYVQFGSDPSLAGDKDTIQNFRRDVLRERAKLKLCWPDLDVVPIKGALEVRACPPSIPPKAITAPAG